MTATEIRDPAGWLARLRRRRALRERAGLGRTLRARDAMENVLDLAGNDYLGLTRDPRVLSAAAEALTMYGAGASGSRLVRGSTRLHAQLEQALAHLLGQPAALVFSSGYLANLAAVAGVVGPGTVIVRDAHVHASLIDACRLTGAQTEVAAHADVTDLAAKLEKFSARPLVVVTESVFSVDGDLAPLREMHALCRRFGAILVVDDAHAVGILGPDGGGAVRAAGLADEPDVVVTATLSKAFGAAGGIVAGPTDFIDHLIQTARPFIYDTALPPAITAAAHAALGVIRHSPELRDSVRRRAATAAEFLRSQGLTVVRPPAAGILAVAAPTAEAAVQWAAACHAKQVAVGCFRPPSTPDPVSRLRLTVNARLSEEDFAAALRVVVATAPAGTVSSRRHVPGSGEH